MHASSCPDLQNWLCAHPHGMKSNTSKPEVMASVSTANLHYTVCLVGTGTLLYESTKVWGLLFVTADLSCVIKLPMSILLNICIENEH